MSIIQTIQEKYAKLMAIIIALALIIFVVMLAFENGGSMFSGNSTTVGKINGKKVEYAEFDQKIKMEEEGARAQGYNIGDAERQQLIERVWNNEIEETLMADQYDELGMTVSTKEINDYLFGNNAPADLRQQFSDSATGQYNPAKLQQYINQMKKDGTPEQKQQLNNYIAGLKKQRRMEKYASLIANTAYVPKWLLEKQNADNSLLGRASYISVPYTTISDSAVKVTDEEISAYIKDHRKEFEQKEETRSISYVVFNAGPSASDSIAARNNLMALRQAFDTVTNYEAFLAANNSAIPYYNGFISKSAMQQPNKDSILSAPSGVVYGPYLDNGQNGSFFVLSKIIAARNVPDTVKARHILIATTQRDPQSGQTMMVRDEQAAKKLADSVRGLLAAGQSFDSLVAKFSDDPGSKDKGGVYEGVTTGRMVAPFNDFLFTNAPGQVDVVKTEFGYHIIEVMQHKGSSTGYKIAYLSRPIETSTETENAASTAASHFAANSRDINSFNANFDKELRNKGLNKLTAQDIKPNDFNIQGLGASRALVRDIFNADKGEVMAPQRLGDAYVVAVVTDITEAGLRSVAQVRTSIEPVIRNRKKAAQIRERIGAITTLEAASAKLGQPIQALDSLRFGGGNQALGFEARVIGAVFNPANKGKVVNESIEGQAGVYVLRVEDVSATAVNNANIAQQRMAIMQQARQQAQAVSPAQSLKASAKIVDNRAKFY